MTPSVAARGILLAAATLLLTGVSDGAPPAAARHRFQIELDFRFAGSYFDAPARRAVLEAAAARWSDVITSDFPTLPRGTKLAVWHPVDKAYRSVTLDHDVDDMIVFVFAYPMSGTTKAVGGPFGAWSAGDAWDRRYNGPAFQPWAGRLEIDTTPARPWFFDATPASADDLPVTTHYDLITTAVHELGHVLGVTQGVIDRRGLADAQHRFIGARAVALNGGAPVPMTSGRGHLAAANTAGLDRPHLEVPVMADRDHLAGFRAYPTPLDLAVLEDLGYAVDATKLHRDPFFSRAAHPDAAAYLAAHRAARADPATAARFPAGLWDLTRRERAARMAILGAPLLYRGPTRADGTVAPLEQRDAAVRVPANATLVAGHDLAPAAGEKAINRFSLVLDVRLPKLGVWYALYNTSGTDAGLAEAYVDPEGRLGKKTYGGPPLAAGTWYRVVITTDNHAGTQRFYVDGALAHIAASRPLDGENSLGARPAYGPWLHLFGGAGGKGAPIDVRRAALYGRALAPSEVARLGGPGGALAAIDALGD